MKHITVMCFLAVAGLLMGCSASKELTQKINASSVLLPKCKALFIGSSGRVAGQYDFNRSAAATPIYRYRGKRYQACYKNEVPLIRPKDFKRQDALAKCEVIRANTMKVVPGVFLEPCRMFMLEGKIVW